MKCCACPFTLCLIQGHFITSPYKTESNAMNLGRKISKGYEKAMEISRSSKYQRNVCRASGEGFIKNFS